VTKPIIIALFNQSGGVAKTTLTQNLGYHLAQKKKQRVLLVDMDPQASPHPLSIANHYPYTAS
jgi:chromosome partitioning protein